MLKNLMMGAAALAIVTSAGAAVAGDAHKMMDKAMGAAEAAKEMPMDKDAAMDMAKDKGAEMAAEAMSEKMDIVETAATAGQFSTLIAAAKAADLVDALKGEGPLTVFAPTDEAFAALPEGTVEDLLKPENKEKLADILKYHVVAGKIMAEDIAEGETPVPTLEGSQLDVMKNEQGVTVDQANVVKANIKTSNGVIHVIDKVVLPN